MLKKDNNQIEILKNKRYELFKELVMKKKHMTNKEKRLEISKLYLNKIQKLNKELLKHTK